MLSSLLLGASLLTAQLGTGQYVQETVPNAPDATGSGGWESAYHKAKAFTSKLELEEKAYMVTGVHGPCVGNIPAIPRLGFSGICLQDGPLALRHSSYSSVFPAGVAAAASWDKDLMRQRGVELGQEFVDKGAHVMLGPVTGPLGRSAKDGRRWEGFSVDPYLTGVGARESIIGSQSTGLQACVKHYIANEQETQRNPSTTDDGETILAVSSNLDDRTMHELYAWPFADAVRAGVASVMCSYNRINETYGCENSKTLNGILKTEMGFQGYVVSDWGGTHSGYKAIHNGLDMDMPGTFNNGQSSYFGPNITTMIQDGQLPEDRLDDMIHRAMTPYYYLHQDSKSYPTIDIETEQIQAYLRGDEYRDYDHQFHLGTPETKSRDVRGDHAKLIRKLGADSAVLLKNKDNALPLKNPGRIAVFGNDAADVSGGPYLPSNAIGAQAVGGGSGTGRLYGMVSPLEAIKQRNPKALIEYIFDDRLIDPLNIKASIYPIADVCLVFLKAYYTEGEDRTSLHMDYNADWVVGNVTASESCPNTVVITHSGGPNAMPWAKNENITAIIAAHFPGEQIGNSIVDILWGDVNPSGKLPYTIAANTEDYNAPIVNFTGTTDPNAWQANFTEGLMVDYRHFDHAGIDPLYEFGFGLSYTDFSFSNLQIHPHGHVQGHDLSPYPEPMHSAIPPPGGNPSLYDTVATITVRIQNTGEIPGATVPQLYLSFPVDCDGGELDSNDTPVKVLRGFEKTMLRPGQDTTVSFELTRRDVSFWDVGYQEWRVPTGEFGVLVGESSRFLPLEGVVRFR